MSTYEAVARRGDSMFMVDVKGKDNTQDQTCTVIDTALRKSWPNLRVQSVLARGYWEPFAGPVDMDEPPVAGGPESGAGA